MSANNIVVIIKGLDGKFRGYHRDMDAWMEGQYEDDAPCFCLAGKEEDIPEPDKGCHLCNGSGKIDSSKETPVFVADTIEGAVCAYYKWFQEEQEKDEFGLFDVEYNFEFVGLKPNQETKETLEKSERGEDLHKMNSVEELMKDLEKDESGDLYPMTIKQRVYTLIRAGEGDTQDIFVGRGREELIENIHYSYKKEIENEKYQNNIEFMETQESSLCKMIEEHEDWSVGRHILKNVEPWWEEWTLFIADMLVKEEFVSLKQENEKLKNKLAVIDEAIRKMFDENDSYVIEDLREMIAEKLGEKFEPWM
jgi:hypothetical protein